MAKLRKSGAIVPSINLSYLNRNKHNDNPTQRHLMQTMVGDDFGPAFLDDDVCAQSDAMTDMVNI